MMVMEKEMQEQETLNTDAKVAAQNKINAVIAGELKVKTHQITAVVELLDDGNTVPFIARYRKEATGSLDEEQIRTIEERVTYLRNLEARRQEILSSIREQEKLTPELENALNMAMKLQILEDLYLPYRPKRRTRGKIARDKGLEDVANLIVGQARKFLIPLEQVVAMHIDGENIKSEEEVWQGAMDIVAEDLSDRADIREMLRKEIWRLGEIASQLVVPEEEASEFLNYKEYTEPIRRIPPHRVLAINRGESKKALKVNLTINEAIVLEKLARKLNLDVSAPLYKYYREAMEDGYKRLIYPSLEREIRNDMTETAEKQAISVFAVNLRALLLTQPIGGHTILGLDPGYRTGCKTAVIDKNGKTLATTAMYVTGSEKQQKEAANTALELIKKYKVSLIAIGNGTASYETEQFAAKLIADNHLDCAYIIVSEAGASVYSASKLAREELPDLDVSLRGAVSIARRVQDPLAELVKIEPKAIGVGQYQHDVNQKTLGQTLETVVESCVNHVGVELNTASPALLGYVAGVSAAVAKNIIAYRDEHGEFASRKELLKVPRLGPAAFTQCAGFLRIKDAKNPLDNTPVHPESYELAEKIIAELGYKLSDSASANLMQAASKANAEAIAKKLDAGVPTVTDILQALARPGRDVREDAPAPLTRKSVAKLSDLAIGSKIRGRVENVVDFGAFVDIGLKQKGLIHKSELSHKYFKHPLEVVKVGDIVETEIISIDEKRGRIGLSLKRVK